MSEHDTTVLGAEPAPEPPRRRKRPNRETTVAIVVSLFLLLFSVTTLRRDGAGSDPERASPGRPGDPLVHGADGRLVFLLPADQADPPNARRLWSVSLRDGSVTAGAFVPPPPESFGDQTITAGPIGTVAESYVAFLASSARRRTSFLYLSDLRTNLPAAVEAVTEAEVFEWAPDGTLHVLVPREDEAGPGLRLETLSVPFGTVDPEVLVPVRRGASFEVVGDRRFLLHADGIDEVRRDRVQTVLEGWRPVSAGPVGPVLVARGAGLQEGDLDATVVDELRLWGPEVDVPYAWPFSDFEPERVLAWSPDGSAFVATGLLRDRAGVWLIPVSLDGDAHLVVPLDSEEGFEPIQHAVVASDGRFVFVGDRMGLHAYNLERARLTRLDLPDPLEHASFARSFAWIPDELGR